MWKTKDRNELALTEPKKSRRAGGAGEKKRGRDIVTVNLDGLAFSYKSSTCQEVKPNNIYFSLPARLSEWTIMGQTSIGGKHVAN